MNDNLHKEKVSLEAILVEKVVGNLIENLDHNNEPCKEVVEVVDYVITNPTHAFV